jgi:hypothetical protein
MSDRGSGPTEVVALGPKLNARSDPNNPLDKAGHLILDMVGQAAIIAEANYQQAVEVSRNLSAQLRGAEDRIRELQATVRQHAERADRAERWLHHRAERWLHQVSVEIEQKFFARENGRPSQPPPPQAHFRNQGR